MIGARKSSGHLSISVDDLAFYYDEMVRSHLMELEIDTPAGKIVLKRLNRGALSHPSRRRTDGPEGAHEFAFYAPHASSQAAPTAPPANFKSIKSPIIGVFYRASSPQSAPFVKEGDVVEAGTTVCIVEAMKVMNEIKSDCRCRVVKFLMENAKPVTKDQPLIHIDPA